MLPIQFDIRLPALTTSIITFVLNYAAYFAEIYRGGINGIDRGQYEAAKALGLSKMQTMVGIVLPQTMKIILPPVSNEAIVLVKDTALASAIGLGELMKASKGAVNRDVDPVSYTHLYARRYARVRRACSRRDRTKLSVSDRCQKR